MILELLFDTYLNIQHTNHLPLAARAKRSLIATPMPIPIG
jgi:hypothetical protein